MQAKVVDARQAVKALSKNTPTAELVKVERTVLVACGRYRQFLNDIDNATATMGTSHLTGLKRPGMEAIVMGEVESSSSPRIAAGLNTPDNSLLGRSVYSKPNVPSSLKIYERIIRRDRLSSIVVALVGTGLGITVLWAANPTFGGMDYLSAFLWGFVSHEAGKSFLGLATSSGALPPKT